MLFVAFLSMHKSALVRTNFTIDVSTLRGRIIFGEISKNVVTLPKLPETKTRKRNLSEMEKSIAEESKTTKKSRG